MFRRVGSLREMAGWVPAGSAALLREYTACGVPVVNAVVVPPDPGGQRSKDEFVTVDLGTPMVPAWAAELLEAWPRDRFSDPRLLDSEMVKSVVWAAYRLPSSEDAAALAQAAAAAARMGGSRAVEQLLAEHRKGR